MSPASYRAAPPRVAWITLAYAISCAKSVPRRLDNSRSEVCLLLRRRPGSEARRLQIPGGAGKKFSRSARRPARLRRGRWGAGRRRTRRGRRLGLLERPGRLVQLLQRPPLRLEVPGLLRRLQITDRLLDPGGRLRRRPGRRLLTGLLLVVLVPGRRGRLL